MGFEYQMGIIVIRDEVPMTQRVVRSMVNMSGINRKVEEEWKERQRQARIRRKMAYKDREAYKKYRQKRHYFKLQY